MYATPFAIPKVPNLDPSMDIPSNTPFHNIGLLARYADPIVCETMINLVTTLKSRGRNVLLDERGAQLTNYHEAHVSTLRSIGETCDLVIVVGGDGTLLNAARSLASYNVPLLGINLGYLGFLADIPPQAMEETLDAVLNGHYESEERCLLHATVLRSGEQISDSDAFNDVVIHRWNVARMIEFETYVNNRFVYSLRADGLIISTTTGSTAHALSAGGPLIYPTLPATLIVPICPHTVSTRPLVVPSESTIEIVLSDSNYEHAQVTCDGQINLGLASGDRVVIRKRDGCVRLIHPEGYDYFRILREKLHWSKKLVGSREPL
ncbi:NAD kinase [Gammaproteobacteria bacterium]